MPAIEVVCPVFQEEETIQLFHTRLVRVVDELSARHACRIIYVLDPAPDRTESILTSISRLDPRVEVLVMSRRFGHQLALLAGIDHCRGDAIIMLDSDLQHPPELMTQLVEI